MESTPTKIWPIFGQLGGQKGQKMANESKEYFKPPLEWDLSHSNGKVVFDHGPKLKKELKVLKDSRKKAL